MTNDCNIVVGTVSEKGNEMSRLFVLPDHQGKGYGKRLMDFAEQLIFQTHSSIELDSSFPAQEIYIKRGYRTLGFNKLPCDNGDYLCYNEMMLEK